MDGTDLAAAETSGGGAATSDFDRAAYAALWTIGAARAVTLLLRIEELARRVRREAGRSDGPQAALRTVDAWLAGLFGRSDASLRRAALAALALGLERRFAELPSSLVSGLPAFRARLLRRLRAAGADGRGDLDAGAYASDLAVAAGAAIPLGAIRVVVPPPAAPETLVRRLRKSLGVAVRLAPRRPREAARHLMQARLKPWAELHLDLGAPAAFNADGFVEAYHGLADLMAARPDLAGVRAASWLYDPALAEISPELAFVRRTAETRGAHILRATTTPAHARLAAVRSPKRRALIEEGAYRPACRAMIWSAHALTAWSGRARAAAAPASTAPRMDGASAQR